MMRSIPLLLALLLSSCGMIPGLSQGGGTPPVTGAQTASAQAAAAQANGAAPAATASRQVNPGEVGAAPLSGATMNPPVDRSKKLEYADLYIDQKDHLSQRALAPYLMKPEEWMIVKVTQITPTYKHYRFQRVATSTGKSMPEIDPLMPKKSNGAP